jgi:hypothetical protein
MRNVNRWDWVTEFVKDGVETYRDFWLNYDVEDVEPTERDLAETTEKIQIKFDGMDIVTAHPENSRENITRWLTENGIHYDNLILSGLTDKATLPYRYYIDDSPNLAKNLRGSGKFLYLYDQLWNRNISGYWLIRIRTLRDVLLGRSKPLSAAIPRDVE